MMSEQIYFSHDQIPWKCHIQELFYNLPISYTPWSMILLAEPISLTCSLFLFSNVSFTYLFYMITSFVRTCLSLDSFYKIDSLCVALPNSPYSFIQQSCSMKVQMKSGHDPAQESLMAPYFS